MFKLVIAFVAMAMAYAQDAPCDCVAMQECMSQNNQDAEHEAHFETMQNFAIQCQEHLQVIGVDVNQLEQCFLDFHSEMTTLKANMDTCTYSGPEGGICVNNAVGARRRRQVLGNAGGAEEGGKGKGGKGKGDKEEGGHHGRKGGKHGFEWPEDYANFTQCMKQKMEESGFQKGKGKGKGKGGGHHFLVKMEECAANNSCSFNCSHTTATFHACKDNIHPSNWRNMHVKKCECVYGLVGANATECQPDEDDEHYARKLAMWENDELDMCDWMGKGKGGKSSEWEDDEEDEEEDEFDEEDGGEEEADAGDDI